MNFYLDTEFYEGLTRPLIGKKEHTIDLISIALLAENGRMYYAVSKEFNLKRAWADEWIRENVLRNIFDEYISNKVSKDFNTNPLLKDFDIYMEFNRRNFRLMLNAIGKDNFTIAEEAKMFVFQQALGKGLEAIFYAYYADYDWVLFCSLFGRMKNLPKGFPMYCRDLKQLMDEVVYKGMEFARVANSEKYPKPERSFEQALEFLKEDSEYPDNSNVHNAKDDVRYNLNLHSFLLNKMAQCQRLIEVALLEKSQKANKNFYIAPNQKL
jgi:hypothetical protein